MKKLKIWIIQTGESLPLDSSVTKGRSLSLAATLAKRGHTVTFWASDFDHAGKRHVEAAQLPRSVDNFSFQYLQGRPYEKNVSVARLLNHRDEARSFMALAPQMDRPDVILCCLPTLDLAEAATALGRSWNVPVLIDIRDMWPKIFANSVPRMLQPLAPVALAPLYRQLSRAASSATGIVGVSRGLVDYALSYTRREFGAADAVFPLASSNAGPSSGSEAATFWDANGLDDGRLVACYTGTLTYRGCSNLLEVARLFNATPQLRERWKLVICGTGELEPELRRMVSESVQLFGWVSQDRVRALLERAQAGVIPYPSQPDFLMVCPNKFGTYLSAGLPVLSHIDGEVGRLIREADCGWVYDSDETFLAALAQAEAGPAAQAARRIRARTLFARDFDAENIYRAFSEHIEAAAG